MSGTQSSGVESLGTGVNTTLYSDARGENSPHKFRRDRGGNMGVNDVFDHDLLVLLISVDSNHGTQSVF